MSILVKTQRALLEMKGSSTQQTGKDGKGRSKPNLSTDLEADPMPLNPIEKRITPETFFPEDEIKVLNAIRKTKNFDAKFIRLMMLIIFKDKESLKFRTISGRSIGEHKSSKLSPEKLNVIYQMFQKRIDSCDLSSIDSCD